LRRLVCVLTDGGDFEGRNSTAGERTIEQGVFLD
jgi:hypothetical protein